MATIQNIIWIVSEKVLEITIGDAWNMLFVFVFKSVVVAKKEKEDWNTTTTSFTPKTQKTNRHMFQMLDVNFLFEIFGIV